MGGTKPLAAWIRDTEQHGISLCKDSGLVVITVVGKDATSSSKLADLNEALGGCCMQSMGETGSIEVFFSIELGVLFLVVNTYKDVAAFSQMSFSSNKEFFDWTGNEESTMEADLAVAFSLSHLVLFIENACRIELTLLQLLQNVNRRRMELIEAMQGDKQTNAENRFAIPRFIFAFHRHLIRKDLGNVKKKELLEKLEESLEDQTFTIFKHYKLLHTGGDASADEALGHIWGEGYVHLMEKTNDISGDLILAKLLSTFDGEADEKDDTETLTNRLFLFLSVHVKKVRDGKKLVYELPSNERFVNTARKLLEAKEKLDVYTDESTFIDKLSAVHVEKATEKYMPSGSNLVLSRVEHEERMASVLESLSSVQANPLDLVALKESFESIWSSDLRSCEYRSIFGNECRLASHASIGDGVDKDKWTLHSSSVTHISACNCGRSQLIRSDPFTVKEANFDFYTHFSCCERAMETHQFKLVADEKGRKLEMMEEEWPEVRIVGQIGERSNEEKREEEDEKEEGGGEVEIEEIEEEEEVETEEDSTSQEEITSDEKNYLESDDLIVKTPKDIQLAKAIEHHEVVTRLRSDEISVIEGVPHMDALHLRPVFPSWSLLCVGKSSVYSHTCGIRGQYGFIGDTHLLPLDVYLEVDSTTWFRDMSYVESIIKSANAFSKGVKRMRKGTITERVKLFVGMEYECSSGHRQLGGGGMDDGIALVEKDLPLYQPCTYRKSPCENAQLMRIHIVTPKAPVTVSINPKIIPSTSATVFYPGETLDLSWSRYYILRLPLVYAGPDGIVAPPKTVGHSGLLLANSISVSYSPLANW